MYEWRRMSKHQREDVLNLRRQCHHPWHSPPHFQSDLPTFFHLSAACYAHEPIIGYLPIRMAEFEAALLRELELCTEAVRAWCVLPNHWHALVKTSDLKGTIRHLGHLHGRLSRKWNQKENMPGRKCWFCSGDRRIRSEAHFWATLNYIHHNPVHHRYVSKWQDWPYSSAVTWLEEVGRKEAAQIWKIYPLLEYGQGWDDPEK